MCKKMTRIKTEKVKDHSKLLKDVLESLKKNESVTQLPGKDYNRFVVLESSTPKQISSLVLQILNHKHNVTGKLIRVIIGDSSRKEGMDLYSIKNVHILSPEYKYSDWHQAISRAIRYCSFKYVPLVKDWKVNIFTYVGYANHTLNKPSPKQKREMQRWRKQRMLDIDEKVLTKANKNAAELLPFVHAFKEGAIDCQINAGMHKSEKIQCDMKNPEINKERPKQVKKTKQPLFKNSEFTWVKFFSRLSPKTLEEWKQKCKEGKCTRVQRNALRIIVSKKTNPFIGNVGNTSVHINDVVTSSQRYHKGYREYNYNKGYKMGANFSKTPQLNNLSQRNTQNNYYWGQKNAQLNAMRNGFRGL